MSDIPKTKCPYCGYAMDCATDPFSRGEDHLPKAGDVSMCLNCGKVAVFTEELGMRLPNKEEAMAIARDGRLIAAQLARAKVVTRDLRR